MLGIFAFISWFFRINFFQLIFQEYHQSVKHFGSKSKFVGPDINPDSLQKLSNDKSPH